MIRIAVDFLGLLLVLPALPARGKPETPTPAQHYRALEREYETADMEFRKAITKLKTNEERRKFIQEKNLSDQFSPRFLELAEKNPKDPAAVDALIWIVVHPGLKRGPQSPLGKAVQVLLRNHVQSEKMATLFQNPIARFALVEERKILARAVLEKSKYRPAQGQACFALANQTETRLRFAQRLQENPEQAKSLEASPLGTESVEALVNADLDKLSKEAEALYLRVIKDFGDVIDSGGKKLGETAKDKLNQLPYPILVGKPAPEIEGEDIDAAKFKLSDYRGKVVLLDFWGHW